MSCRLLHFGGWPGLVPTGSSGSSAVQLRVDQVQPPRHRYAGHEVFGSTRPFRARTPVRLDASRERFAVANWEEKVATAVCVQTRTSGYI